MPATAEEIDADNAAMEKKKPRFGGVGQMSQELRTRYGLTGATNMPPTNNLK
jgi:hypothetical protein